MVKSQKSLSLEHGVRLLLGDVRFVNVLMDVPPDEPPFFLHMAKLAEDDPDFCTGWAASLTKSSAVKRSQLECVERTALYRFSECLHIQNIDSLNEAKRLSMDRIAGIPTSACQTGQFIPAIWTPSINALTREEVYLPLELVAGKGSLGNLLREPTTTGCAIGSTHQDAMLAGLLEVLERHLFMEWYSCGRSLAEVTPTSVELLDYVQLLKKYRLTVRLFRLATDFAPIECTMAVLFDTTDCGPAVTAGLSAGFDFLETAQKAIEEAWQPRLWLRSTRLNRGDVNMQRSKIVSMEDRGHYWWPNSRIRDAQTMLHGARMVREDQLPKLQYVGFYEMVEQLSDVDADVYTVNIPNYIDTDSLHVVRTIVPSCLPLYFDETYAYAGSSESPQCTGPHLFL